MVARKISGDFKNCRRIELLGKIGDDGETLTKRMGSKPVGEGLQGGQVFILHSS
jgi:hypothetical protein